MARRRDRAPERSVRRARMPALASRRRRYVYQRHARAPINKKNTRASVTKASSAYPLQPVHIKYKVDFCFLAHPPPLAERTKTREEDGDKETYSHCIHIRASSSLHETSVYPSPTRNDRRRRRKKQREIAKGHCSSHLRLLLAQVTLGLVHEEYTSHVTRYPPLPQQHHHHHIKQNNTKK